jgi:hypothetical protein
MKTEKDIFCRAARSVYAFGVRGGAWTSRPWCGRGAASSGDCSVGRRTILPSQRILLLLPKRPLVLLKLKERTWVELPRDHYPKEVRFKQKGKGDERGRDLKRGHEKGSLDDW